MFGWREETTRRCRTQLQVKMMKQNPDMMKQMMLAQLGGKDADKTKAKQIEDALDQFTQMDDKKLEQYLKYANTVQTVTKPVTVMNTFKATKNMLGVSAKTLIVLINIVFVIGATRFING